MNVCKADDSAKVGNKKLDSWRFPKIAIQKLYKNNPFTIFPSYSIKDAEQTIAFKSTDKVINYINLLSFSFLQDFMKKKHKFLHLGLVQVSIKPLERDGLESPIIVCLKDSRQTGLKNSLLAAVETNLSKGTFYFNCFPSFSVSLTDISYDEALQLTVKTKGNPRGVSLALTVRVVCKAMVDLRDGYLEVPVLGKTTYFHAVSGTPATTQWDEITTDRETD